MPIDIKLPGEEQIDSPYPMIDVCITFSSKISLERNNVLVLKLIESISNGPKVTIIINRFYSLPFWDFFPTSYM